MTDPLFVADLDTLKSKLRLTELPDSSSAVGILDEVILVSRLKFYRRLLNDRVATLVALPFNANPTTEDEILRALANVVEVKLVRCELLRRLPTTFMDSSGDVNERWNEEAPVREQGVFEAEQEILRCEEEIEADMRILEGDQSLGSECRIQSFDGSPVCPRPDLGATIRRSQNGLIIPE